jgi:hypothetical protein
MVRRCGALAERNRRRSVAVSVARSIGRFALIGAAAGATTIGCRENGTQSDPAGIGGSSSAGVGAPGGGDRLAAGGSSSILDARTYDRLELVAVRFDLCDRPLPGVCPPTDDGRLRLVFQPLSANSGAEDVGFHAFYAIYNDEVARAIAALRDLAGLAPPQSGALRVSPALTAADSEAYANALRAFVRRFGGESRLVRLTVNAQPQTSAQVRWVLRGVEKKGDAFVDIKIVGTTEVSQSVILSDPSFDVEPVTDTPPGLHGAISSARFAEGRRHAA